MKSFVCLFALLACAFAASFNQDDLAVGDVVGTFTTDYAGTVTWQLTSEGTTALGADSYALSGADIIVTSIPATVNSYSVLAEVVDGTPQDSDTVTFNVFADNEAAFTPDAAKNEDAYSVGDQLATGSDADDDFTSVVATPDPATVGMAVDGAGTFTVVDTSLLATTTFSIDTTDATGGVSTSISLTITITPDNEAAFTPDAAKNEDAYTVGDQLATGSDGDGAFSSVVATPDPATVGMAVDGTGTFTVVDTSLLTTTTFSVDTTDAAGGLSTTSVTITITEDNEASYPTIVLSSNTPGVVGVPTDADGAIVSAAFSGTAPTGVSVDASTGAISVDGTLAEGGYQFYVATEDEDGGQSLVRVTLVYTTCSTSGTCKRKSGVGSLTLCHVTSAIKKDRYIVQQDCATTSSLPAKLAQGDFLATSAISCTCPPTVAI